MANQKFNISKPEKYEKDGEEKTSWLNVGFMNVLTKEDGSKSIFIKIPAIGLEAQAFPQEDKKQGN